MKNLIKILFPLCFVSCAASKETVEDRRNKEIIKGFTVCKCIEKFIGKKGFKDDDEVGSGEYRNLMDSRGVYTRLIEPQIDELLKQEFDKPLSPRDSNSYAGPLNQTSYLFECLEFYHSRKLDSLVNNFPRRSFMVKDAIKYELK